MAYYLSNLEVLGLQEGGEEPEEAVCPSFAALFAGYGMTGGRPSGETEGCRTGNAPTSHAPLIEMLSEVTQRTIEGVDPLAIDYLVYCHELLNPPEEITPTMQLKSRTRLKKAVSFSLKDQGAATPLTALDLLSLFGKEKTESRHVLVCGDRVTAPQPRQIQQSFVRGDAAVAMQVRADAGPFQVLDQRMRTWSVGEDTSASLDATDVQKLEASWADEIVRQMQSLQETEQGELLPSYLCVQNVSETFIKRLEEKGLGERLYRRHLYATANLMTSDVFYSLHELWESGRLKAGELILLAFVGTLGAVGTLLLAYDGTSSLFLTNGG